MAIKVERNVKATSVTDEGFVTVKIEVLVKDGDRVISRSVERERFDPAHKTETDVSTKIADANTDKLNPVNLVKAAWTPEVVQARKDAVAELEARGQAGLRRPADFR